MSPWPVRDPASQSLHRPGPDEVPVLRVDVDTSPVSNPDDNLQLITIHKLKISLLQMEFQYPLQTGEFTQNYVSIVTEPLAPQQF